MKRIYLSGALAATLLAGLAGCSPKVTPGPTEEETTQTEQPQPPREQPGEELSPCKKFSDAPNPDQAETNYVLYRDFLKAGDMDQAFELWKKVYDEAPAADGRRNTVFADGFIFYESFLAEAGTQEQKERYIDTIFMLYDAVDRCYPEGGYISARKAFDLYYKYPDRVPKKEVYELFKTAIDQDGLKTPDFVLNPFTSLLVELHNKDEITTEEARRYQEEVRKILAHGMENCKGEACDRWTMVEEYVPSRLEAFETVQGFFGCEYYMNKYYANFDSSQTDCDELRTIYSRLKWGGCPETDERFQKLIRIGNQNCSKGAGPVKIAYDCLENADYECAVSEFERVAEAADDPEKKGRYLLLVAKVYNAHLRNFPKARQYAYKAAEARPDWGEPYILIGRLYASSGPLCGPGRGWESQVVVWPAIDMWNKAKRVDPDVTEEANKWINQYYQYMPSTEDVFIRNLKKGDSFKVGCWIQETTTIRTPK